MILSNTPQEGYEELPTFTTMNITQTDLEIDHTSALIAYIGIAIRILFTITCYVYLSAYGFQ